MTIDLESIETNIQFRSDIVVDFRDSMGNDRSIIEAMLVSSDKDDISEYLEEKSMAGRIRYLMRNRHGTPFEHNAMKFRVEAPIFVFREWHRHRIGFSYNELSGRYSELPPMFYIPPKERPLIQIGKPGNYEYVMASEEEYNDLVKEMKNEAIIQYEMYKRKLQRGIAKEVARMSLGVNVYSKMYVTLNARSLMAFLSLRTKHPPYLERVDLIDVDSSRDWEGLDLWCKNENGAMFPSSPMYEINQAANQLEKCFKPLFPLTWEAFSMYGRVAP